MARVRMVTRTINVSMCEVMCVDTTTATVETKVFELTGEKYTSEVALKELKKAYETDTLKVVALQGITTSEVMYGLTEIDFLKVAHKLDSTTRKIIESDAE